MRKTRGERAAELREAGAGTLEINQIIRREELQYRIEDIENLEDVKAVLMAIVNRL